MIKHVVTMDKDDFTTLESVMTRLRSNMNHLPDTHIKSEIRRCINEIEDILGIEPPEIPEAVTARWRIWVDPMLRRQVGYCTHCNNREEVTDGESLPTVCPQCKAVITGVE